MARVKVNKQGLKNLKIAIKGVGKQKCFVGWLESAKYSDSASVAMIAKQNEYGNPALGIPPRPTMRPTVEEKRQEWARLLESGIKALLEGRQTMTNVLKALGMKTTADLKNAIAIYNGLALKDSTVKARMRKKANGKKVGDLTKPLVEEGIMLASLISEVIDG